MVFKNSPGLHWTLSPVHKAPPFECHCFGTKLTCFGRNQDRNLFSGRHCISMFNWCYSSGSLNLCRFCSLHSVISDGCRKNLFCSEYPLLERRVVLLHTEVVLISIISLCYLETPEMITRCISYHYFYYCNILVVFLLLSILLLPVFLYSVSHFHTNNGLISFVLFIVDN